MSIITYTIFADEDLSEVRQVASLKDADARFVIDAFRRGLKREPRVGDVWIGCRIEILEG